MKKYLFFPAVAMTIFVACNQKEMDFNKESVTEPEIETVQMTFRAATEDAPTKTTLDEGTGAVAWAAGDAVKFVYELDKTPKSITSDALAAEDIDGEGVATFTANLPKAFTMTEEEYQAGDTKKSLHLYAVSPASIDIDYSSASSFLLTVPTEQDGSFANASIALAKWDKTKPSATLKFYNLCGLLKFTVTDAAVRKVVLHSDDYIAGKMDISFTGPAVKNFKDEDGEKTITVNVSGAGTYYIAVLPTDAEKGIGINNIYVELLDKDDNLIGDKASANPLVIARKQIRNLGTLTTGFSDRFYVKVDGSGDGTSWDNAANWSSLKTLLAGSVGKNIYIAGGTYPFSSNFGSNGTTDGNIVFRVYGGYPSDATGHSIGNRDVTANETIFDGENKARIWVLQSGTFYIDGITFYRGKRLSSGSNDTGSALIVERNGSKVLDVTVNNCTFRENSNEKSGGGAVRIGGSTTPVQIIDCTFENNSATVASGGAIFVAANRSVKIKGCTFTGNTSKTEGGAFYVAGTVTATDCAFTDNSASGNGGVVYIVSGGTVTATNCTFGESGHPNRSTLQGGAIYLNGGTIDLDSCIFSNNEATTNGGAIQTNGGTLKAYNCNFLENKSTKTGGTIQAAGATTLHFNQCTFVDNASVGGNTDDLSDEANQTSHASVLYIGGTSTIFLNSCYLGQSSTSFQPAVVQYNKSESSTVYYPFLILTGTNAQAGFNNCVICGPFAPTGGGRLVHFGGNTVVVNSTIYSQVSLASIYRSNGTGEDACKIINSIVLNNSSSKVSFTTASGYVMRVYNSIYSNSNGSGSFTATGSITGKYNAATPDANAFPGTPWGQKSLGTSSTLPSGRDIKVYDWDGVCDGFTKTTLADIKTLISGTTGVGSAFLTWLESEDLKVNGKEALSVDIRGVARNTSAMWPGSYEQASGVASAPAFTVK